MTAARPGPAPAGVIRHRGVWTAFAVVVGCVVVTDVVTLLQYQGGAPHPYENWLEITASALSYGLMGLLIAVRAPGNRLGPLMLGLGLVASLQGFFGVLGLVIRDAGITGPLDEVPAGITRACQMLFVGGVVVLLLLAPTGRPLSKRWGYVVGATALGVLSGALDAALFREFTEAGGQLQGLPAALSAVLNGLGLGIVAGLLAAPLCLGLRWYRSRGLERQQVLWVAAGGIAGPLLIVGANVLPQWVFDAMQSVEGWFHGSLLWAMAGAALPAGVAVAVLRHRLFDIDRVLSRTTSYVLVTGIVVGVYSAVVAATSWLLPGSDSVSVAGATLAAAAAFRPALRRVRAVVDRRFNRRQYDAERTVNRFAGRLRDEVDPEVVTADLVTVLRSTMEPTVVGVWLQRR